MLLVIDTATAACSVALVDDTGEVVAHAHELVGRGHAERLLPMIAALPGGGRADAILVDVGPGSFTGVRVGLAAARGLGLGWGAAVHGFSSLVAIGWAALAEGGADRVAAALPGGHGELFVQRFTAGPFTAFPLANLPPASAAAFAGDDALAGPAAEAMATAGARGPIVGRDAASAAIAARLPAAWRALPPTPLYGRAPDAKLPG